MKAPPYFHLAGIALAKNTAVTLTESTRRVYALSCILAASAVRAYSALYSTGPGTCGGAAIPSHYYKPPAYAIGAIPSGDLATVTLQLIASPLAYDKINLNVSGSIPVPMAGAYYVSRDGYTSPTALHFIPDTKNTNQIDSVTFDFDAPNLSGDSMTVALVLKYPQGSLNGFRLISWAFHEAGGNWGRYCSELLATFAPVPAPGLSLSYSDQNITIAWPTNSPGFTLESASLLDGAAWNPVSDPKTTNGGYFTTTVACTNGQKFFRLRAP